MLFHHRINFVIVIYAFFPNLLGFTVDFAIVFDFWMYVRFYISTKFRGAPGQFRFDLFYIVDFHSAHSQPGHVGAEWKSTM